MFMTCEWGPWLLKISVVHDVKNISKECGITFDCTDLLEMILDNHRMGFMTNGKPH